LQLEGDALPVEEGERVELLVVEAIHVLPQHPEARREAAVQEGLDVCDAATRPRFGADKFNVIVVKAITIGIVVNQLVELLLPHAFLQSGIYVDLDLFVLPEHRLLVEDDELGFVGRQEYARAILRQHLDLLVEGVVVLLALNALVLQHMLYIINVSRAEILEYVVVFLELGILLSVATEFRRALERGVVNNSLALQFPIQLLIQFPARSLAALRWTLWALVKLVRLCFGLH